MRICVIGNCQQIGLAACIQVMLPDAEVVGMYSSELLPLPKNTDLVIIQVHLESLLDERYWEDVPRSAIKFIPPFTYAAFHPDQIYVPVGNSFLQSPLGDYNSALVLYGWMKGLSPSKTVRLFCDLVFQRLNYYEYGSASRQQLCAFGDRCGIDLRPLLDEWSAQGCFAHSINYPKLFVLS